MGPLENDNGESGSGYPTSARPYINKYHVDGPMLCLRDGRIHWLTRWERVLLFFGRTDAYKLERKHWCDQWKGMML